MRTGCPSRITKPAGKDRTPSRGNGEGRRAREPGWWAAPSQPLWRQLFQSDPAPFLESVSSRRNTAQELGMVLETIVEPVLLALEPDKNTGWLAMPRDEDLFGLGQAEEPRQVILDFSQRHLAHRACHAP